MKAEWIDETPHDRRTFPVGEIIEKNAPVIAAVNAHIATLNKDIAELVGMLRAVIRSDNSAYSRINPRLDSIARALLSKYPERGEER